MIEATDASFTQEVVESTDTVIVDFWAPWCGPCKSLSPLFAAAAEKHTDVKFVKVNIDETEIAMKFGVRGIPTLMVFKGGQPVATKVGMVPESALEQFITANK